MVPTDEAQAISEEMAELHLRAYERTLRRPVITEIKGERVCCRLAIELNPTDDILVAHGMHDAVHRARHSFHEKLSPALRAMVEHATGRKVTDHHTHIDLRAHLTIETFLLAPAAKLRAA